MALRTFQVDSNFWVSLYNKRVEFTLDDSELDLDDEYTIFDYVKELMYDVVYQGLQDIGENQYSTFDIEDWEVTKILEFEWNM